jgi:hypothetical protein
VQIARLQVVVAEPDRPAQRHLVRIAVIVFDHRELFFAQQPAVQDNLVVHSVTQLVVNQVMRCLQIPGGVHGLRVL